MKYYGIDLTEGSEIINLTVPTGTAFPSNPNDGELFYRTDLTAYYGYQNGSWTSPHDQTYGAYEARNSLSDPVMPPEAAPGHGP